MTKRARAWSVLTGGLLALVLCMTVQARAQAQPPANDEYVSVRNGHLFLHGQRVRFWGAIGGFPGANARDNTAVVKRLKAMGFNLVRYWASPQSETYTPGDNSETDRTDQFLAACKAEGLHVWCAALNGGTARPDDARIVADPATEAVWREAVGKDGMNLSGNIARAWDPRLHALGIAHAQQIAGHVNKHTGLKWADDPVFAIWELSNEEWWFGHMVGGEFQRLPAFFQTELLAQWNRFLQHKYGSDDKLRAAWRFLLPGESLDKQNVLLLPLRGSVDPGAQRKALGVGEAAGVVQPYAPTDFVRTRGEDVIAFLLDIWLRHKQAEADALKPTGRSLTNAPLCWDTGIGYEIQAQYLHQHADAVAHDTYITGFHHDPTAKRYPWYSGLEELPRLCWDKPWVEQNKVEGKPYFVYETQIEQPAKYRAEYPMRVAGLGAIQDWDAVCWHYFGGVPDSSKPRPYESAMDYTDAGGHPQGYHYQNDEVQMSAMRLAAALFTQGLLQPAPTPTQFIYGRKSLLDPRSMDYGNSYGETGLSMMPTTYRYGVRIKIDPSREDDQVIGPSYRPRIYEPNPIAPTDQIVYDWQKGFLRFDAPGAAMFTGFYAQAGGPVTFRNGVVLRDVQIVNAPGMPYPVTASEQYLEFGLASLDGLPLTQTRHAVLSLVSTSFNSGFKLDLSKLTHEFGWFLNPGATVSRGGLPVLTARVGATIVMPALNGMRYRLLDWHLQEMKTGTIAGGSLTVPANLPVFLVDLQRTSGQTARSTRR